MSFRLSSLLLLSSFVSCVFAGGVCTCKPSKVTFKLALTSSCGTSSLAKGDPGILDIECSITGSVSGTPVAISSIDIYEFDQSRKIIGQSNVFDAARNGDTFSYESVSSVTAVTYTNRLANLTASRPSGLEIEIVGYTAENETLINRVVILMNNDCSAAPVLTSGMYIGWIEIVSMFNIIYLWDFRRISPVFMYIFSMASFSFLSIYSSSIYR
jgi:hypothetical protein